MWEKLQTAFRELKSLPYIVFVGDFQQLQPVQGLHQLQRDLEAQAAGLRMGGYYPKALLEAILSKLPHDDKWDENIPRELALKEQGEKRYHYQKKNLTIQGQPTKDKDVLQAGGDFKKQDAQLLLQDNAAPPVSIKVENPKLVESTPAAAGSQPKAVIAQL